MGKPRRLPSWLLVAATGAIGVAALQLEAAGLFPLWRLAVQWSPSALPSTQAVPGVEIKSGLPVLSLAVGEADLYGPERGVLANISKHGADWERPGSVSYFEGGRLLFASGVGVRVHGGGSRITSPRQGFRLFFRRQYGPREFAPGILFDPDAQPIRRLIVHNDVRRDRDGTDWHLVNPLAYDIAQAMGAIAPDTKPVRFFLNGEDYGPFVLTERFDERFFAAHWGYDDVVISQASFDELRGWVDRTRPLTMEAVAGQVDLENLTRWFLAVAFCATRDAYQGPGQFLDRTRPQAGWFWVNWDMDQSFRNWDLDSYQYLLEPVVERPRGRNRAESRPTLLTHLIAEDAGYRDSFKRIFLHLMNHRVTETFLEERYRHYADVARRLGVERLDYLPRLREFLTRRPAFFRQITEQWLNAPPSQPLTLVAPGEVPLIVDGEQVKSGYRGLYFPDLEVVVKVPGEHHARFSGWLVNGRPVAPILPLALKVDRPTRVEALFDGDTRVAAAMPEPALPSKQAPRDRPRVVWRRIPASSFWMGCVPGDATCEPDEMPRHQARIDEPFDMMDREVAASDFQAFAAATGRQMPRQPEWHAGPDHPVVNLTWDEAQAYCGWMDGRLPTEEQWEYAARGGREGNLFPWGDEFRGKANGRGTTDGDQWGFTAPVGSFEPNSFGLRDLAGNVWEWTDSLHRTTYENPAADRGYELRTIRGGSWDSSPVRLRTSERTALSRRGRHNLYVGFRCVRSVFR